MNQAPPPPPSPIVTWAFFLGALAIGVALVIYSVREMKNEGALGEGAQTIAARVVDTRVMTSRKRGDSYQVRYAFEVGGRTYTYGDATGREDLWASLEQGAWERGRREGTVAVRYLPTNPSVNRAVDEANERLFGQIVGMIMGVLCMSPALLAGFAALRKRRTS